MVSYDLSVLSMSVMGFQKKIGWGGGGVSSINKFWNLFNFAKPLGVGHTVSAYNIIAR